LEQNNVIVLHFTFRTKSNRLTDMIIYCFSLNLSTNPEIQNCQRLLWYKLIANFVHTLLSHKITLLFDNYLLPHIYVSKLWIFIGDDYIMGRKTCKFKPSTKCNFYFTYLGIINVTSKDNLLRRSIIPSSDIMCVADCGTSETATHLFLGCRISTSVWYHVLNWLGISSVDPYVLRDHCIQFSNMAGMPRSAHIL